MGLFWIWVAFGVVCAFVAPSRGRSGLGWFFLGVLFSVFALIVLLALPSKAEQETDYQPTFLSETPRPTLVADDPTKTCPRCAETVKAAALVCRFCGNEFAPTARAV